MWKRKDNLTDVVEQLPKVDVSASAEPSKDQQVINPAGELVTLGHEKDKTASKDIQGFLLELSPTQIRDIISNAFDKAIEKTRARRK